MQVDHGKYAWLWLKAQHPLEISLVLPSRTVDQCCTLVVANEVSMNMPGNKNIGDFWNY